MRLVAVIGTSMLGVLLGITPLARAQHGHEDGRHEDSKDHGNKHEEHGRSDQHSDKHSARGPEHREGHGKPEHHEAHYDRGHGPEHVHNANFHEHDQRFRSHDVWYGHRAKHWEHEHRSWHDRGGYRGYRIPPDRFRAHFGRAHWFRVHSAPLVVVGGFPRFQYGGFWFSVVDPWPEYWAPNWYEADDVYVDYVNDGYYMYNRRHPGVAVAVNVSF
jgi:hypothetical protein